MFQAMKHLSGEQLVLISFVPLLALFAYAWYLGRQPDLPVSRPRTEDQPQRRAVVQVSQPAPRPEPKPQPAPAPPPAPAAMSDGEVRKVASGIFFGIVVPSKSDPTAVSKALSDVRASLPSSDAYRVEARVREMQSTMNSS